MILSVFSPAAKENRSSFWLIYIVDSISRTKMESKFMNSALHRLSVTRIAQTKSPNSSNDSCLLSNISDSFKPLFELASLPYYLWSSLYPVGYTRSTNIVNPTQTFSIDGAIFYWMASSSMPFTWPDQGNVYCKFSTATACSHQLKFRQSAVSVSK